MCSRACTSLHPRSRHGTIVNRAPPSGQFSAQTRPCSTASRPRAIQRPIPVPDARVFRGGAAVEAVEHVRQIGRRDARAMVANARSTRPRSDVRATSRRRSVDPGRRVLGGVLEQVGERRRGQPRIQPHRAHPCSIATVDLVPGSVCSTWSRAAATISDGCVQRDSVAMAPASIRAISSDVLEQPGQPLDLRQDELALSGAVLGREPGRHDVARGDADGGQRRSKIVSERRQQRGLELLALARQLARLALFEKLRAFDGDGHDARERVERAGLDRPAGGGQHPDRLRADAQAAPAGSSRPSTVIVRWPA